MQNVATELPQSTGKATVLFVDDEPRVLTSMRAMFRRIYRVKTAAGAAEALTIMASEPVSVVVSDQRMPGITGVELLSQLKIQYPHCMRILLTGYADLEAIEASINDGEVFRYLVKPCPPVELKRVVELAVEATRAEAARAAVVAEPVHLTPVPTRVADVAFDQEQEVPVLTNEVAHLAHEAAESGEPGSALDVDSAGYAVATVASDQELAQAHQGVVDVLVLSRDENLHVSVAEAMADELRVHHANFLDEALDLMAAEAIGVLVTDLAVNEAEVSLMTRELKQQVPQLVTILAAQRSDANLLIDLINQGQVFRFLLKPVPKAQCRIWLRSAVNKHRELLQSPEALLRHVVDKSETDATISEEFLQSSSDRDHLQAGGPEQADSTAPLAASGSLLRYRGKELRQLLEEKSTQVAKRMEAFVDDGSRAISSVRGSAPVRSVAAQFNSLKQRISQWKASHG